MKDVRARLESLVDEGAMAFIEPLFDEVESDEAIECWEGDARCDELYREAGRPLVVLGDLTVDGPVLLEEHAWVVVTGDLVATHVWSTAALYVHGSLRASGGLVYLNSLNDYSVCIGGALDARLLIEEGMHTTVCGSFEGQVLSSQNAVRTGRDRHHWARVHADAFERVIVAEAFEPDARGNGGLREGLFELLRARRRVLLDG